MHIKPSHQSFHFHSQGINIYRRSKKKKQINNRMDAKLRPANIALEHEDFEPSTEWKREDGYDALQVFLPGFRREQLKVQVTSTRNLRISGERPLGNNRNSRFHKEFPIASNIDTNGISAKFEDGILSVKQPKSITPAKPQESVKPPAEAPKPPKPTGESQKPAAETPKPQKPTNEPQRPAAEAPKPQKPANETQPQKNDQENVARQVSKDKITKAKSNELENDNKAPHKTPEKEKVSGNANAKIGTRDANNISQKSQEKKKDDGLDEKGKVTTTSAKHENLDDAVDKAAKKEQGADAITSGNAKFTLENYKTALGGLVEKLKAPRKLMNFVVVILFVLVLGLYAKNAITSVRKPKN